MIYFVRHGQTDWNLEERYQGQTDIELNQTGIKQAEELMGKLKDINFDIVIASPLKRAHKTAQIIYNGNISTDIRLMEKHFGKLEGVKCELVKLTDQNETEFEIEPLTTFKERISKFWDEILETHCDKNILVVAHGIVGKYTQCYFNGEPEDGDYSKYKIENCGVLQFENK